MLEYNSEVKERLGARVPASEIQQKGHTGVRYTSDQFVINRLDSAVGAENWSEDYITVAYGQPVRQRVNKSGDEKTLIGTITCKLTILGVTKSGVCDLELPDEVMYGGPGTNGQAKAFKRAAMKHGIARELWTNEEDNGAAAPVPNQPQRPMPNRNAPATPAPQASGNRPAISEKQRQLLKDMFLSDALIDELEGADVRSADFKGKDLIGILKKKRPSNATEASTIVYNVTGKYVEENNNGDDLLGDEDEA